MNQLYTVYKTKYIVDGRYYIGVHKTNNPNDRYLGSGTHLKAAMKLYGRSNFKKEILAAFSSAEPAYEMEGKLVTPELISSGKVFNCIAGGSISPDWLESRRIARRGKKQPNISKARRKNSPMVGNFLVSYPRGITDDPEAVLFEPVNDLLEWGERLQFSESTVRHLMNTGLTAKQGPLRGIFIRRGNL